MKTINHILLIDDDFVCNFMNELILRKYYRTTRISVATSGFEGLKIINDSCKNQSCPDLILLDINMPLMNGFEFFNQLKQLKILPKSIDVIVLSSSLNSSDLKSATACGSSGYITKPLTVQKLLNTLLELEISV